MCPFWLQFEGCKCKNLILNCINQQVTSKEFKTNFISYCPSHLSFDRKIWHAYQLSINLIETVLKKWSRCFLFKGLIIFSPLYLAYNPNVLVEPMHFNIAAQNKFVIHTNWDRGSNLINKTECMSVCLYVLQEKTIHIVTSSQVLYSRWKFITLQSSIHYSWLQFTTLLDL
jgi:hypothetical protein